ncbi:MAG: ANTAR domain-containing protein [Oscillospiraceae bacterium]|nr:ANTAR domain-containing protein [Oscillospiraceae bacterium]
MDDRALIVSGSEKAMETIAQFLHTYGYTNLTSTASGSEARRLTNSMEYALIIVNTPLSDEFGHELSVTLAENTSSGIILLCKADIADDVSDKVGDYGVCVVSRPMNKAILHQSIRLVEATRSRMLGLKRENSKLLVKIDEMRLINRAKFALMQYLGLPEPEAHRYIEKQAMDTRSTRKEVAMQILSTYETH